MTTHNNRKRQTSMPPVCLEPTIPASQRPQTHNIDSAATGTGSSFKMVVLCRLLEVITSLSYINGNSNNSRSVLCATVCIFRMIHIFLLEFWINKLGSSLMARSLHHVSLCFVKNFTVITQRIIITIFSSSCL